MKQSLMKTLTYDSRKLHNKGWLRAIYILVFNVAFSLSISKVIDIQHLESYLKVLIIITCYSSLLYLSIRVIKRIIRNDTAVMQTYIQYGKGTIRFIRCYYQGKRYRYDIHEIKDISYVNVTNKEIEILGNVFKTKDTHGDAEVTEQSKAVLRIKNTFKNAKELAEGWNK